MRSWPLTILIFVSGAVLMALEIVGSRVLAPFFGSSVFVWGSLISIFLGAMSGGYWLGGWLSERWPKPVLLNGLLAAAGGLILVLPLWASPLCQALASGPQANIDLGPRLGPLTAALVLFAIPSVLMGVASPFAVRLLATDLSKVGVVAGRLYAVATMGSIAGTLLTAFWLIPTFGVKAILTSIGALLVATAVLTLPAGRPRLMIFVTGIFLVVLRFALEMPLLLAQPGHGKFEILEARDSAYTSMMVVDHLLPVADEHNVRVARQLRFDNYVQGAIFINQWQQRGREHWSAAPYTDLFHLVRLFTPHLERVLFIGGGVGVGPRSFRRHYPEAYIDLVEIDPVVIEMAQSHFGLNPDAQLSVHIADGRAFLRSNPESRWDAIILDAFTIGGRLPFHLMTQEFVGEMRSHLTPGGVVLANLPTALAGELGGIMRAEYLTYRKVFDEVRVFPRLDRRETDKGSPAWWARRRNVFLAATDSVVPNTQVNLIMRAENLWGDLARPPHAREDTELFYLSFHAENVLDDALVKEHLDLAGVQPLTDDYAPVDALAFDGR